VLIEDVPGCICGGTIVELGEEGGILNTRIYVPYTEEVIVSTTGELLPIGGPFKSTDLLSVSLKGTNN
jgi:hypothetical protein